MLCSDLLVLHHTIHTTCIHPKGLKKEAAFFRQHPVYGRDRALLAKCGTSCLAQFLNVILMHHIRDCLPELKNRITSMATDVNQELEALGSPGTSGPSAGGELLRLLSKFSSNYSAIIEGRGGQNDLRGHKTKCNPFRELFGGARVSYIFTEVFAASIMGVGPFDGLSDEEIRTTICNAHGTRPALFVPEVSFDILIRRQISRLEQPGVQCVDLVYEELQRIASQSEPPELTRFPNLRDRMMEVVNSLLKRCMEPTQLMVSNLVKIELAVSDFGMRAASAGFACVLRLIVLSLHLLNFVRTKSTSIRAIRILLVVRER